MALPKPGTKIDWTDGDAAKVEEPTVGKKLLGWIASERPPFKFMNFLFFNLGEWVDYLESVTDEVLAATPQAVVDAGGSGTHTTLQAAHDDASIVAGSVIKIISDLSVTATTTITKPDIAIEMVPGKRILKDAGAPAAGFVGVQITATADRVRLNHLGFGRLANEFDGAGDIALEIVAGASDVYVNNPIFAPGNSSDITDAGTDTAINQPQNVAV